jgi:predicted TIM-barrel fold metal-dependent hydrolase
MMRVTRRTFMGGVAMAGAGLALREPSASNVEGPTWDFHVHLFGQGDGGTGCRFSPKQRRHWNYPFFLKLLNVSENGRMDQDFVSELVRQLRASSVQKAVLLAQDARYDEHGKPDFESTNFYVPNEYLFRVVRDHASLFVPCASINPKRRDAIEELERSAEHGARVVKIHPPTQDVNPAEERFRPFYRRVADRGTILMVHTGSEHASEVTDPALTDPARLLPALEEGCTVVAAHSGMGSFLDREPFREDFLRNLVALTARFPKLYCDTAVLASMFRWRNIPRILDEPALVNRLIYASDWPFTSNALVFWNRLRPGRLLSLCAERNLFERDYQLKRSLGLPEHVFQRGSRLLSEVESTSVRP